MRHLLPIAALAALLITGSAYADSYRDAVAQWRSYQDVASWLNQNFSFDKHRQKQVIKRLKKHGPSGLLVRDAQALYEGSSQGYCGDSANFAIESLNRIDPAYNARWVFIWNELGPPNHWVAAFDYQGKLYIMDYGTGRKWAEMEGTHGPYNSLDEYREYLASLEMPGFQVGRVIFREMPGQVD